MDLPQRPGVQDVADDLRLVEDVRAGVRLQCAVGLGGHFGAQIAQVEAHWLPLMEAAPTVPESRFHPPILDGRSRHVLLRIRGAPHCRHTAGSRNSGSDSAHVRQPHRTRCRRSACSGVPTRLGVAHRGHGVSAADTARASSRVGYSSTSVVPSRAARRSACRVMRMAHARPPGGSSRDSATAVSELAAESALITRGDAARYRQDRWLPSGKVRPNAELRDFCPGPHRKANRNEREAGRNLRLGLRFVPRKHRADHAASCSGAGPNTSGRSSYRDTAPAVARSMAAQCSAGTCRAPRCSHPQTCGCLMVPPIRRASSA